MNVHEALNSIAWDRKEYFWWKFPDVCFYLSKLLKTEAEFLELTFSLSVKDINICLEKA